MLLLDMSPEAEDDRGLYGAKKARKSGRKSTRGGPRKPRGDVKATRRDVKIRTRVGRLGSRWSARLQGNGSSAPARSPVLCRLRKLTRRAGNRRF